MNEISKIEKILRLADLGYSRLEIEQLLAEKEEKSAEKEGLIDLLATEKPEKTEEKPEKEPVPTPEPRVGTHEEGAQNSDSELAKKLEGIESTLKAIQSQNVRWSNMPETKETTEFDVVNQILGGISNNGNE